MTAIRNVMSVTALGLLILIPFPAYTDIRLIVLSLAAFSILGFTAIRGIIIERRIRSLIDDLSGPLSKAASRLGRGISTFASGDLRVQVRHPDALPMTAEGKAIAEILAMDINDFNSTTAVPSKRISFTGANSYQEGNLAGRTIAAFLGGKGTVACEIPMYTQINHVLRMKGCLDHLSNYPGIEWAGTFEGGGNRETAVVCTSKILEKLPNLNVIYVTDGHTPVSVAETLKKNGRNEIKLVAFDAMPDNIELLKAGRIECLIEQNSFAQAYNAIVLLYNALESGWRPISPKLFSEPIVIDRNNYKNFWDDVNNARILKEEELAQLVKPVPRKSEKRYRLALILPLSTGFFEGLARGGEAARKQLGQYNVEVEIIDVFNTWGDFGSASRFMPAIESYIKKGFDGISLTVNDPNIVVGINRASEAGLTVTTLNTEPFSFRELVQNMIQNVELLAESSQGLAAAAEESSRSNAQIGSAIAGIKGDIGEQKQSLDANDIELSGLNDMISSTVSSIESYSSLVSRMTAESRSGSKSSDETYADTQTLKIAIEGIAKELAEFQERLRDVETFAGTIEQLAESTNVLAINASIQAARAGTAGKTFAVVAGEVRTLAESSHRAAEGIRGIVGSVKLNMDEIIMISENGTKQVNANLDRARHTKNAFESISAVLQEANEAIMKIDKSVGGIHSAGAMVKKNMTAIEGMSKTTLNRLDEITVSVSEMGLQSAHLSQTANDLRVMTVNQNTVFSQVTVKD